jgi:hypothetical protein
MIETMGWWRGLSCFWNALREPDPATTRISELARAEVQMVTKHRCIFNESNCHNPTRTSNNPSDLKLSGQQFNALKSADGERRNAKAGQGGMYVQSAMVSSCHKSL